MSKNQKDQRFSIQTIVDYLTSKKVIKSYRITYQVVWNLILFFFIAVVSVTLFVGGAGAGFFASLVKDEPIRSKEEMAKDIYNYEEITEVYFANNVLLGELPTEIERREVDLSEVSPFVIDALIATEDEYFFEHEGVVPKAILRATFQEFTNSSIQTGGSTLTQQLIKNQILTNEVSFERKAKEILLAMRLENFFNKEEILSAYLNIVPFGRNANGRQVAGVQAAAQGVFGVDAKDLNLPQAAYIAGLPQSPFGYTPFMSQGRGIKESIEPSLNRMKTVLSRMKEKGYITNEQYTEALSYDIRANLTEPTKTTLQEYPYLMQEVERRAVEILAEKMLANEGIVLKEIEDVEKRQEISSKYRELARRDLRRNGYQIHTTINKEIYEAHEEIVKNDNLFAGPNNLGQPEEVGAILLNNKTGAIVSFVGGRDFWRESTNHATQAYRQNGSTMKPILAYAPAIEIGAVQPGFILADTPLYYKNEPSKEIKNFDHRHRGLLTAREALQRSRNVPAVRSFNKIPHDYARETLEKLGFTNLINGEPFEPTSIGGLHIGVTVEQNTNAFSVFANEGKRIPSYMIEKIVSKDGDVVFEHEIEEIEVFSPQTAYLTVDMMRDVHVSPGTATGLPGMLNFRTDLAGKTGTTNNNYDSWYVGLNPNFSMGVWIGYDTNRPLRGSTGLRTQRIWAQLANAAYKIDPEFIGTKEKFKMPGGIVRQSFCGISGLLPSELCNKAGLVKTDLFNSKFVPKKADDSLTEVDFVMIKGEPYRALENTPAEFTQKGISIKEKYFDVENILEYLPEDWENIIPDREAKENGKKPSPLANVTLNGSTLTWSEHSEDDIIGYKVYQAANGSNSFVHVANIRSDQELSFKVPNGTFAYKITAIDVVGNESEQSNIVSNKGWQDTPIIDDRDKNEDKKPPKNGDEDDDDSNIPDPIDELSYHKTNDQSLLVKFRNVI